MADFMGPERSVSMSGVWARRHMARAESMLRRTGGGGRYSRGAVEETDVSEIIE